MGLNLYVVLGSAVVGLLVGLTGAGGGALMTPMLILLFGGQAGRGHLQRPGRRGGDAARRRRRSPAQGHGEPAHGRADDARLGADGVPRRVPAARDGRQLGRQQHVEIALGAALLVGAARHGAALRAGPAVGPACAPARSSEVTLRPVPTVLIGMIGGLIVGITSVGSGSLMIILLLFTYPLLSAGQLVGTDLTQAVPLTAAAALGALTFGHVEFGVTASIIVGSVPAVLIGSLLSSRAPDKYIRPAITFVIFASGLKYVGVPTYPLGFVMGGILLAGAAYWLAVRAAPAASRSREPAPALAPAAVPAAGEARARAGQRRSTKRRSGDRSARVLLHEGADGRQRGRDVLGRAAADAAVGLDDRGPARRPPPARRSPRARHRTPRRRAWPGSRRTRRRRSR